MFGRELGAFANQLANTLGGKRSFPSRKRVVSVMGESLEGARKRLKRQKWNAGAGLASIDFIRLFETRRFAVNCLVILDQPAEI